MEQMHESRSNPAGASLPATSKFYKRPLVVVGQYLAGVVMISLGLATIALVFSILTNLFN